MLRRQPLRDLEPGPGLRLISPKRARAMMSTDLHSGNYVSPFDSDPGKPDSQIDAIYT